MKKLLPLVFAAFMLVLTSSALAELSSEERWQALLYADGLWDNRTNDYDNIEFEMYDIEWVVRPDTKKSEGVVDFSLHQKGEEIEEVLAEKTRVERDETKPIFVGKFPSVDALSEALGDRYSSGVSSVDSKTKEEKTPAYEEEAENTVPKNKYREPKSSPIEDSDGNKEGEKEESIITKILKWLFTR